MPTEPAPSLYHWVLEGLMTGEVTALVPVNDTDGKPGLYGVKIEPRPGSQFKDCVYSPSQGERCAAAVVAIALCRQAARDDNFATP